MGTGIALDAAGIEPVMESSAGALHRAFWMSVVAATVGLWAAPTSARCNKAQKKCAPPAGQARPDLAMIVPVVTDDAGKPLVDVQVKVDGEPLARRLDGRPLPVAPGPHEFSFTARVGPWPGRDVSTTEQITIVQGQRGPIAVSLPSPDADDANATWPPPAAFAGTVDPETTGERSKPPDKPSPDRPAPEAPAPAEAPPPVPRLGGGPSAFAYLVGGVGAVGLGAGALLTYWGKTDNDALSQCAPNCQPSSVDHIRRLYLAADLSFGAGGAALGVATLLFATSHPGDATAKAPARAAYRFDVRPTRSGGLALFEGAF